MRSVVLEIFILIIYRFRMFMQGKCANSHSITDTHFLHNISFVLSEHTHLSKMNGITKNYSSNSGQSSDAPMALYICGYCGRCFTDENAIRLHFETCHGVPDERAR